MKTRGWMQGLAVLLLSVVVMSLIIIPFVILAEILHIEGESDPGQIYEQIQRAVSLLGASLWILLRKKPPHDDLIRQLPPKRKHTAGMLISAVLLGICFSYWCQLALSLLLKGEMPHDNSMTRLAVSLSDGGYPFAKIWLSPSFLLEVLAICICFPFFEELTCRGVLLTCFRKDMPFPAAAVLSSLIFAVLHLQPYRIPDTFLFGFLLCLIVQRTDSLLLPFLVHFSNNLFTSAASNMAYRSMLYRIPAVCIAAVLTMLAVCLLIRSIKAQPPHLPEPTLQEAKISQ